MRRFWLSTEFYSTASILAALTVFGPSQLPILWLSIFFNGTIAAYIIGRVLWKKNRGQFYSGILTSEFYFGLVAESFNVWSLFHGSNPIVAWGFIVGIAVIYNICRGITKAIGVRTNTMIL